MATASISGLGSGLDTASIIEQFMQLEAMPQTRLKSRLSSEKSVVSVLQSLNTKIAALATKAADLAKPATWAAVTATSSDAKVSVTTSSGAAPGSFSVRVVETAASHRLEHTSVVGMDDPATVPTSVQISNRATPLTTDGTLRGLVTAINDPANATGLRATAVQVSTGQYRLVVESAATGAASAFTLTDANSSELLGGATVRAGRDAEIVVGDSITVTSPSNTFTGLMSGVSVTLAADAATGTTSQVTLARDPAALTTSVKGLVDAVNAALADIDTQSKAGGVKGSSGPLAGDSSVREVRDRLLSSVFPTDGTTLADLGIQTDRTGRLVLDEAAFKKAYDADPVAVQARMAGGSGFVDRVAEAAKAATDRTTGTLTTAITGRNESIKRLDDGIEAWDMRLELRRTTLTRQFTALETALSRMNSQSSWLAGQISSLPTSGS